MSSSALEKALLRVLNDAPIKSTLAFAASQNYFEPMKSTPLKVDRKMKVTFHIQPLCDEKDFWMDFILEYFKFYSAPLEPWRALTSKTIKTDIQHELCIKIQPIY